MPGLEFLYPYTPYAISGSISLSYVLLYTAYDKGKKCLVPANLVDLVLARRGVDWTLVELNKALSLTGLTIMMVSFLPALNTDEDSKTLLWISMNCLWVHSVYSSYKFYSLDVRRLLSEKIVRKVSICLGACGQFALSLGFFGYMGYDYLIGAATCLGMAHFWSYEVDYKYVLQVRPYAYLPFPLAAVVLGALTYKYLPK